jgi:hypothetical protein
MAIMRAGFQAGGGSPDFSGTQKKGTPQRKALSMALKMLAETLLSNRQKQVLTPENDEADSPEDSSSPEIRDAESVPNRRRAKSKTLYGDARSKPFPASSSKPEGIKKGSKFG